MPIINFMNPITLLVGVILFVLVSYLGKKTKKSWIVAIMLFVFITLLICYAVQFLTLNPNTPELAASQTALLQTSGITLVDDIEAKMGKRKSIDNSMDWFWRNV